MYRKIAFENCDTPTCVSAILQRYTNLVGDKAILWDSIIELFRMGMVRIENGKNAILVVDREKLLALPMNRSFGTKRVSDF